MSGQPWSTPSGDPLAAEPHQPPRPPTPSYQPGYAPLPTPNAQASGPPEGYPPTSQFPAQPHYDAQAGYPPPDQPGQYPPPPAYPQPGHQQPGYQQPGHQQPGYQQAGYGPPPNYGQPAYGPPPPAPKRSNVPLVAVLVAVVLLLCAGGVTSAVLLVNNAKNKAEETIESLPDLPTELPNLPTDVPTELPTDLPTELPTGLPTGLPNVPDLDPNQEIEVEYEVTGDGPVEIVYVDKLGGETQRVRNASLPWRKTLTMKGSALVSVIAVRGATSEGSLSCSAKVDGEEVAQKTSEGTFITAACTKLVF